MKHALITILLTLTALPALAQRNPYPANCQVGAIDRYNRIIAHFYGRIDPRNGMCRDGMRNCLHEIRRRGWYDVRCIELRNRW